MVFSNFVMQSLQDLTVGQDYAVAALTRAVTLALAGIRSRSGVLGVLLFIGPTSSGKTHMARTFARILTGSEEAMIYINCQQIDEADPFASLETQLRLAYWQPSFEAPVLNIVVFEEIDKAPASFLDGLAVALERGAISTPRRVLPLRNSFVILMSDLSRKKADQLVGRPIGFFLDGETALEMSRRQALALEEVDNRLGARLVGRIDEIVVFDRLNEQNIITLLERRLTKIEKYLAGFCVGFIIDQEAKTFLLREGIADLNHGARQISRAVRNHLEFPLADLMLSRRLVPGTTVAVKYDPIRSFLNFEIMIPTLMPAEFPAARAHAMNA